MKLKSDSEIYQIYRYGELTIISIHYTNFEFHEFYRRQNPSDTYVRFHTSQIEPIPVKFKPHLTINTISRP